MKDYDKKFNRELEKILNEVYYNSIDMGETKIKRAVIPTEKRFIDYLEEIGLIKRITGGDGNGKWGLQLERKGFEVFEKYKGWSDYKKQVIDKQNNLSRYKYLSQKFWWIPMFISLLALIVSIIALISKK